jgi:hypothetical protein
VMMINGKNNMKDIAARISLVALLSIYSLFSIGIVKATHFCMGREASVVFFSAEAKKCACSIYAGEKDSCCDDEHELLRIENEQKVISVFALQLPQWIELGELVTDTCLAYYKIESPEWKEFSQESLPPKIPLWKMQCKMVFYDDGVVA